MTHRVGLGVALPPELKELLRPGENVIWSGKPAGRVYALAQAPVLPIDFLLLGLPTIGILVAADPGAWRIGAALFLALFVAVSVIRVRGHRDLLYVLTARRLVLQRGFLLRRFEIVELDRVTEITVKVGSWDRWLGGTTGSLEVYTDPEPRTFLGWRRRTKEHIPDPWSVRARVMEFVPRAP